MNMDAAGLTGGVVWRKVLRFFFPLLLGSLFQQLYSAVDAVIVGRFAGKEALAAIDATFSMVRLFVSLFAGVASGATILISQQYGAQKGREVSECVHTAAGFALLGGVWMAVLGIACTPFGVRLMGVPDDIRAQTITYLRIYFMGMIPSMAYNMGAGILRAVGDSKRPLYFLIVSSIVNVLLDLLFVAVFDFGVAGAAAATVIAQAVSAALCFVTLTRVEGPHRLTPRRVRLSPGVLRAVFLYLYLWGSICWRHPGHGRNVPAYAPHPA